MSSYFSDITDEELVELGTHWAAVFQGVLQREQPLKEAYASCDLDIEQCVDTFF